MKTLYLAWQDRENRRWYPIGRLTSNGTYRFAYIKGALEAQEQANFTALPSFPDFDLVYESHELFPIFANRVPSRSRSDYAEYIHWLSIGDDDDPMALLARSGGRRATDTLEVFPCPEKGVDGLYHIHFFVHGLSHRSADTIERVGELHQGESLLLFYDLQNPADPHAIGLRTAEKKPGDMHIIGYCPRYLVEEIHKLIEVHGPSAVVIRVERINLEPAPIQFRVLCSLTMEWPSDFEAFKSETFEPITDIQLALTSSTAS